ncbi:hypothetical protein [Acidimangrovimonas pyrenivorans]|uniref:Sulfotransferase family protein n=1 Tax=Acidimangrovimonas pyrenivorans TaxID=2030798 RepID=A0ABV7AER6_9RHOB
MIVVESIGFAGTHSLSHILSRLPGFEVSHGSQNFETRAPVGQGSQTVEAFADSMVRTAAAGKRPVAVHCLFDPARFKPACERRGIRFHLLVRAPAAQIDSCYAWAAKKVLAGDQAAFVAALQNALDLLQRLGVALSLPNLLYAYACGHVCGYTLAGLEAGAVPLQMERVLNDESAFRAAFEVPQEVELEGIGGDGTRLASHRADPALAALAEPERAAILARMRFQSGGRSWSVAEIAAALGY